MSEITLTDQNFQSEVLSSDMPVLVDFWAPWCGPCQIMAPIIEEITNEFQGKIKVGKLNVDENSKTAASYGIMSIPTLVVFKAGKITKQMVGYQNKDTLKQQLDALLVTA